MIMNKQTTVKRKPKSEMFMTKMLDQMEKMVDEKLANLKTFIPIIFTIITSVIAFFFVTEFNINDSKTAQFYMLILGVLLCAFIALIVSSFAKIDYKEIQKGNKNQPFLPHKLNTYLNLSDAQFVLYVKNYANRSLTDAELLRINMLKQKVNEFRFRRNFVNFAFIIVIIGALLLAATCFFLSFGVFNTSVQ